MKKYSIDDYTVFLYNDIRDINDTILWRIAHRKFEMLNAAAVLGDLKIPPSNHLELLKGNFKGYYSIRINDQWRIIFRWEKGHVEKVKVLDYH